MKLRLNGPQRELSLDPKTPLLWALRDELGLVGAKFGCGIGQCGACTVHIDGKAVRSCSMPLSTVGTKAITTIEGLDTVTGQQVQQAWQAEHVSQCGYCQAGQIMTAVALLNQTSNPTATEVDTAMKDIICRCGTYLRIRNAIQHAVELGGV